MIGKYVKVYHCDIYAALITVGLSAFGVTPSLGAAFYHIVFFIPGMIVTVLLARWVGRQQAKE
jgi:hypothetical protein